MTRLTLFDHFDRAEEGDSSAKLPIRTVGELTAQIKATLERGFANVAVRGEISGLSRPRSGHVYFKLKDDTAQISAVLWKSDAERLVFELADGLAVRAWGKIAVYAPRGEYQLTIRDLEPEGIGALELAFRQTVERLKAEGLFDVERKRPLPRFPKRIVVVSSPTGAAVRDFLQVVDRRWRSVEVLIAPAKVQGIGAAKEVADAIAMANRISGVDFIVLARGGGSLEDLWAFNEEVVARAIFASRLPIVSAVGHEIDVTVADLVADVRALTPSEAGERCVPDLEEVRRHIERLGQRLHHAGRGRIDDARYQLDRLKDRLNQSILRDLEAKRFKLGRAAASLEALSPLGVLARGYSVTTRDGHGDLLRASNEVAPGDLIQTRLASGSLVSEVVEVRS